MPFILNQPQNYIRLDRRITIQRKQDYIEPVTMEPQYIWGDLLVDLPAAIQYSTGNKETFTDNQTTASESITFTVRYTSVITTNDRILYGDKHYNIQSINEVGRRQFLEIAAVYRQGAPGNS